MQGTTPAVGMLLDSVQELLCVIEADGLLVWAGPAWQRELGHDPASLPGRNLCDLAHHDDRERVALELMSLRERGAAVSGFECRVVGCDGGVLWVRWRAVPDPDGGFALSGLDVTALRESARPGVDRASLLASALDAIVSIDAEGRVVEFNPSAERTFGWTRHEALGQVLADLIIPEGQRAAHREGVRRAAQGGPFTLLGKRLEVNALHSDGSEFPAELTITHTSEDPFMVTAFVRDLSDRHRADEALRRSEERFSQAFTQAPVGIALVSIDAASPGRLLQVNDALCRMMRNTEEQLLAADVVGLTHPEDREENQALFADLVAGRRGGHTIERRILRADGTTMWALVHSTVAHDANGAPMYGISQIQDVTERKEAERALLDSEATLARTQRLAGIGSWEWSVADDRFTWSEGLNHVFGIPSADRPIGRDAFMAMVHPHDRERVQGILETALQGRLAQSWEYRALGGDGCVFHMYAWGDVVLDDQGVLLRLGGYVQDVSERKQAEEQAAGLRRDNEHILNAAADGIFRLDREGRATFVNPAATRILGFSAEELQGRPIHDAIHHSNREGTAQPPDECPMLLSARDGEIRRVADDVFWRKDGSPVAVDLKSAPIRVGDELTGAVVVFSDVTERRGMEDQLRRFAELDSLTGLLNRRCFEQRLDERLAGESGDGALLLLDLDHFKFVNDSFGHAAGDDLIRAVATVLEEQTRDGDILARLGGDEFAVLLPPGEAGQAQAVANRLITGIEHAHPSGLGISASVGAACFAAGEHTTRGDLLVAADIALYEAKDSGRARVAFFAGQPGTSLTWVERIRAALDEDRLVLHSQPIIDLATREQVREELLVRLLAEDGAIVPPSSFLPTAESFGLIGDIDRWVLRRGVAVAALGRRVNVNLSGRSVGDPEILDELEALVAQTRADPADIVIELTETLAVANLAEARAFARRLRKIGCGLALDDFGTGFGAFTYLKHLPADYLKIDMEFVRHLAHSEADRRVVDAIVGIASRFGQKTIAEGVEDEATVAALCDAGVDYAQGFHLGRPEPLETDGPG